MLETSHFGKFCCIFDPLPQRQLQSKAQAPAQTASSAFLRHVGLAMKKPGSRSHWKNASGGQTPNQMIIGNIPGILPLSVAAISKVERARAKVPPTAPPHQHQHHPRTKSIVQGHAALHWQATFSHALEAGLDLVTKFL